MKKELTNLSLYQQIRNEIEEGSKNGKRRFKLTDLEYRFKASHSTIVNILYSIEQIRIDAKLRPFARYPSKNEKGHSVLSEIEIPKDDERGAALIAAEETKSKRALEAKAARHNNKFTAAAEDMKKFNFQGRYKLILSSTKNILLQKGEKQNNATP